MNKKGQLYVQSQIEQAIGKVISSICSSKKFNNNTIPDLGIEYMNTIADMDLQQNTNKYEWGDLPDYLPGWLIEEMLYYRGVLCGFIKGGVLRILPYTQRGGINIYGMPNKVQPVTFNGIVVDNAKTDGLDLITNYSGGISEEAQAVLLFDRMPKFGNDMIQSRAVLNSCLIKYQADLLARIKINLQNSNKRQVFYVEDEKQKTQMQNDLELAYGSSNPFIIVCKDMASQIENEPLQRSADELQTQSLFEAWQSVNSIRCMASGVSNGGAFEKKERQITGELQGDNVQTDLILDAGLKMRRLFIEQMKIAYPEYMDILGKITVKINSNSENNNVEKIDENIDVEENKK